jgi:hypothetical protein
VRLRNRDAIADLNWINNHESSVVRDTFLHAIADYEDSVELTQLRLRCYADDQQAAIIAGQAWASSLSKTPMAAAAEDTASAAADSGTMLEGSKLATKLKKANAKLKKLEVELAKTKKERDSLKAANKELKEQNASLSKVSRVQKRQAAAAPRAAGAGDEPQSKRRKDSVALSSLTPSSASVLGGAANSHASMQEAGAVEPTAVAVHDEGVPPPLLKNRACKSKSTDSMQEEFEVAEILDHHCGVPQEDGSHTILLKVHWKGFDSTVIN